MESGQRQWTESEAKAVLEDLRTDVRVGDQAGDTDEDEDYNYYYNAHEEEEEEGGDGDWQSS